MICVNSSISSSLQFNFFVILKHQLSVLFFVLFFHGALKASTVEPILLPLESIAFSENEANLSPLGAHEISVKKLKLISLLQNATVENKKVTAAILTLTLGMLGVHRIYLGTAPYIPAVYLFTFGGGFFILPIIDLVMILSTKDITQFENNKRLLMWTGEE